MKISKTGFTNIIRCDRYAALEEIYRKKNQALVTFSDNMDDLMTSENKIKTETLLNDMYDEDDEDLIVKEDIQLNAMMPYYNEIEGLTAKAVKKMFEGEFTFNMLDTYKQKKFEMEKSGYHFYCFLDGFLAQSHGFKVFESKATTSRKYMDMMHNKESMFAYSPEGILMLTKDLGFETDEKYDKKLEKLLDRYSDVGRYVYDLAFQRFVIEHASDKPEGDQKYYLAVLNKDYIFDGKKDENGKPIYDESIIVFIDFTSITKLYLPIIEADMQTVINNLDTMNANPVPLGKHCQRKDRKQCPFFDVCWKHVPAKNSILTYLNNHNGFTDPSGEKHDRYDLLNDGVLDLLQIPEDWLTRENNVIQRRVVEGNEPYYNFRKIREGILELRYPIYHLDFESFPCPLPRYKGESPYMQSLFQYSIHIEHEPGVCDKDLDNYYFLAGDHNDPREALIKGMIDIIKPDGGSVLVYNIAFEKTRINELARLFPAYKDRLLDIADRLFDLMDIVKGNTKLYKNLGYDESEAKKINYYHTDLNGSYSIKKVLPLFSNLTYKGMPIGNGSEALVTYSQFPNMDKKTFERNYKDLINYCKQDTWAMVEILNELRKIAGVR